MLASYQATSAMASLDQAAGTLLDSWRDGKMLSDKAEANWLNVLSGAVCRYRLTRPQLEAALVPTLRRVHQQFGSLPLWMTPFVTKSGEVQISVAAYNELARRGACLEMQETPSEWGKLVIGGIVGGLAVLVATLLWRKRPK